MVYLFLPSCMIVMYNVFVILCLEKRGGLAVFNYTNFLYVRTTIFVRSTLFVRSSHSNLQRTRKVVRRLITLRLTFLRSNRQNDSTNARSLLGVINNKRINELDIFFLNLRDGE